MNRIRFAFVAAVLSALAATPASADEVYFQFVDHSSGCEHPYVGPPTVVNCTHSATATNDGRATINLMAEPLVPNTAGAGEAYGDVGFSTVYRLQHAADRLRITVNVALESAISDVSGVVTDTVGPAGSLAWVRMGVGAEHIGCTCPGEPNQDVTALVEDWGDGSYFPFSQPEPLAPKTLSNQELVYSVVVSDRHERPMPPGDVEIYFRADAIAYLGGLGLDTGTASASVDFAIASLTIQAE